MKNHYRISVLTSLALFCFALTTSVKAQVINTIAGNGTNGYSGDGGYATAANISNPYGGAVDKAGNFFFSDNGNQRIREIVKSTGDIITIAGNGTAGYTDGPASGTMVNYPVGLALDTAGNLYFVDANNYRIRKIDMSTGNVSTVAGSGSSSYSGSNIPASAAGMQPQWIALDDSSNMYITDPVDQRVYKVYAKNNQLIALAGNGKSAYWADGGRADTSSISFPEGIALDKNRNIYFADYNNNRIRKINAVTNIISTIAGTGTGGESGNGGLANLAQVYSPTAISVDTLNGNVYICDPNDVVRVIDGTTSIITNFAGVGGVGFGGDGGQAAVAQIYGPYGLAIDKADNVYLTDQLNERIREIYVHGPGIISQPAFSKPAMCNYSSEAIGITAAGTGLTYQWQVDTMGTWRTLTNAGVYSAVNTDSLKISQIYFNGYSPAYRCLVTGSGDTITSQIVYLYVNTLPSVTLSGNPDSICPGAPVTLNATIGGGSIIKPHKAVLTSFVVWNSIDTSNSYSVSPKVTTTYSVAATQNGCTTDTTIIVHVDRDKPIPTAFPSSTLCAGGNISLYGSGGSGAYTWSGGSGNVENGVGFTPTATATYTLTSVDVMGCVMQDSIKITVNPLPVVTATATPKDTICRGGSVTLTGSGAKTYNWSGGASNGVPFSPSSSAVYYLDATDANGCTASTSVPVVVNILPVITGSASPAAVCKGASVSLAGNGGVSYSWSGGVTNALPFVPAASGTYTLTGTDAHGCSNTASVGVTVNLLPAVVASAFPSATLCQGSSLALFGSGGASYAWTGGVNNGVSFTPSVSASYTVTGIDANGCTNKDSIKVTVHNKVVPTLISANTSCGLKNGSASVTASNGIPPYSYSWSTTPASTSSMVDSLAPGTYVVTVSDSANCASTAAVSIGASTAPILSVSTTNSNCGSHGTGSANVVVTGGNTPYHFMWNNGDTLASDYNLKAGTYIITVKDVNGCSSFAPAIVSNANGPKINTTSIFNVKCNGAATGAINISVTGGTGPYQYNWSTGATSASIANLFAGPYQLTVMDADSCISVENFTITQPAVVAVSTSAVKADCTIADGSASVSVTGGLAPYSYKWSNGATANVDASVLAGVYGVVITDANGCADSVLVAVSNKTGPAAVMTVSSNASCGNGGLVSVSASGGLTPYSYKWNTGSSSSAISNVPAGNYYVSVTDANGCIGSADTSIFEAAPAPVSICMVTVDPISNKHNILIWDKSLSKKIAHYNIYKESTSAGVYFKIDSVSVDSAGTYVDKLSDPTVRSWRYKISQVDSCGNESPLSHAHKTMHLTVNQGLGDNINLIWDNYEGLAFSTYYVYRDTVATNFTLLDSIPNNIITYTDNNPIKTLKPLLYRIGISNPGGCTPAIEAINYNSSKSNTGNITFVPGAVQNVAANQGSLSIFPNPSSGMFTINFNTPKGSKTLSLSVVNTLGQVVASQSYPDTPAAFTKQLDLSDLAKGVYFIKLSSDISTIYNKIVIQ